MLKIIYAKLKSNYLFESAHICIHNVTHVEIWGVVKIVP